MAKECVQVKIEIGHKSVCRTEPTPEGYTHDWFVFVRGTEGSNISHFVDKVVFYLHESFPKPRRVLKEPPYKLEESGYGSFLLPIEIYFKNKDEPKKVRVEYDLCLQMFGSPPVNNVRVEAITFSDPLEDFKKRLVKAGGVVLPPLAVGAAATSPAHEGVVPLAVKPDPVPMSAASVYPAPLPEVPLPLKKTKASPLPYVALSPLLAPKSKPKEAAGLSNGSATANKRMLPSDDGVGSLPKVKKKKIDKQGEVAFKPLSLADMALVSPPFYAEADKSKTKQLPAVTKKSKDVKERRKSVDAFSPTSVPKKPFPKDSPVDTRQPKGKEMKDARQAKLEKARRDEAKIKADMKVQKITMKRTSHDAWSSTVPGSAKGPVLPGKKLDVTMGDFKPGISSSDDDNNSLEGVVAITEKETKENIGNVKIETSNIQGKNTKPKRTAKKTEGPAKVNGIRRKDSRSHLKPAVNGKNSKVLPSLLDLHRRICSIQDGTTLQKVVDIVGGTGLFEITSSTFDFDLCTLDQDTINRLQCSLSETVS